MSWITGWFNRGKSQPTVRGTVGNVEFTRLEPRELKEVSVVAQALDNQWVPRSILKTMLHSRKRRGLRDVADSLNPVARAEFIRSLLTTEQVVVNRAYLSNTAAVRAVHLPGSRDREAFKGLLKEGTIVPSLLYESSPDEPPVFNVHQEGFRSWQHICEEVHTQCVRLSWDDADNRKKVDGLDVRFRAYVSSLSAIAEGDESGNRLLSDLGLPPEELNRFRKQLREISGWTASQPGKVRRNDLYKQFIVAPRSDPVDGLYDPAKPFSGELKQLLDLSYAVNLPDALGRYALTPVDSLPRTSLQEVTVRYAENPHKVTASELKRLLQRQVFAQVMAALGEEGFLRSLHHLSLAEVQTVRGSNEWAVYIAEVRRLLANPLSFETRAGTIFASYVELARVITRVSAQARAGGILERWSPAITLMINIGGALISATMNPSGLGLPAQVAYNFAGNVAQDATQVVARMIIGGISNRGAQARLENSIDFMNAQMNNARQQWGELIEEIQRMQDKQREEQAAEALRRSEDLYDPNINFSEEVKTVEVAA